LDHVVRGEGSGDENDHAALSGAALLSAGGCTSRSSEVEASYVSRFQYQGYSYRQVAAESKRINSRAAQVSG
jgi:hypothetical protein